MKNGSRGRFYALFWVMAALAALVYRPEGGQGAEGAWQGCARGLDPSVTDPNAADASPQSRTRTLNHNADLSMFCLHSSA